jgi:predicted GNAT superfamily acetyltransferase
MFEWEADGKRFLIRDVEGEAEYHAIEDIQREAWSFSDLDVVPFSTLIATKCAGGIVIGAFEGDYMIGFAYGFPGYEDGHASIHSHMLAVRPVYRNARAGHYLKLAQRREALEKGIDEITWTFDPLQSLNAHLNFTKLGVISNRYIVNLYGEESSSPLHKGFGTDRLWVRWLLESDRVRELAERAASGSAPTAAAPLTAQPRIVFAESGRPRFADVRECLAENRCLIEIPYDINALKERDPEAGVEWREATRAAFQSALEAGFTVTGFVKLREDERTTCFYILAR